MHCIFDRAWNIFLSPILKLQSNLTEILNQVAKVSPNGVFITKIKESLANIDEPTHKDIISAARKSLRYTINEKTPEKEKLARWIDDIINEVQPKFSSHLYSETKGANTSIISVTEQPRASVTVTKYAPLHNPVRSSKVSPVLQRYI